MPMKDRANPELLALRVQYLLPQNAFSRRKTLRSPNKKARIPAGYEFYFDFLCFAVHASSFLIASLKAGSSTWV